LKILSVYFSNGIS